MEDKKLVKADSNSTKNSSDIDFLNLLGIKVDNGKIEIDTNSTKAFFEGLQEKVESKVKDIEESIKEGKVDLKDSVGVKVDDSKIEIDLNKTKTFLDDISNRFKSFVESIDSSIRDISKDK